MFRKTVLLNFLILSFLSHSSQAADQRYEDCIQQGALTGFIACFLCYFQIIGGFHVVVVDTCKNNTVSCPVVDTYINNQAPCVNQMGRNNRNNKKNN